MSMRFAGSLIVGLVMSGHAPALRADDVMFQYEGTIHPASAGFEVFDPCEPPCSSDVVDGAFRLNWAEPNDQVNYHRNLPSGLTSLWVEWRFRSTRPLGENFFGCDGEFQVIFGNIFDLIGFYGDAAITRSGDAALLGLELGAYRVFRFEYRGADPYVFSVDGRILSEVEADAGGLLESIQFRGLGGCTTKTVTETINEWDYVWYGTLSSDERLVASDPPAGFLDPRFKKPFDRFAVTFDAANYAYIDDISVESIGGEAPEVIATRRRDDDGPETFEVVLDRPIPALGQTRFIFDDGTTRSVVDYSFIRGDASGDGAIDLRDFRDLQRCIGQTAVDRCTAFDFDGDGAIDTYDAASFFATLTPPRE